MPINTTGYNAHFISDVEISQSLNVDDPAKA